MNMIVPKLQPSAQAIVSTLDHSMATQLGGAAVYFPNEIQTAALEYVEAGLALVSAPVRSKGPTNKSWNKPEQAITLPADVANVTGNIGLAHAYCASGPTCSLDMDQLDKACELLRQDGIDLDAEMSNDDSVRIESGKPNSGKLLYRLPQGTPPLPSKVIKDHNNRVVIEFRCATATGLTVQDILPPSLHPAGTTYRWAGAGCWSNLPVIPPALLTIWKRLIESAGHAPNNGAMELIESAETDLMEEQWSDLESALFALKADDYQRWIDMGQALKRTGERGRLLWMRWSATCPELFDEDQAAAKWNSFNPTLLNYKSVFKAAQDGGWVNPAKTRTHRDTGQEPLYGNAEGWPEPLKLPPALKPVPEFGIGVLPDAIQAWVKDCAYRFQAPVEYFVMPLLATAGIILGNRVGIQPKAHDTAWVVFPILWGAVVGSPGSLKTPTLNEALRPVRHLEAVAMQCYKAEMVKYEQAHALYQQQIGGKKPKPGIAPPPVPLGTPPQKPILQRYCVNDVTYQKLGEILEQNPNGVIAIADELTGLLLSLNAQGQEAARGFYLAGWGGNSSYSFDRVGRGTVILNRFALSVFGGFQPDKIKSYVQDASAGSSDNDGLLQRFQLLAWPDEIEDVQFVDQAPDKVAEQAMHAAILQLATINKRALSGAVTRPDGTVVFQFTPDAQDTFNKWYQVNERFVRREDLDSPQCSHFAKYRSLIPALGLLWHLIDGHDGGVCLTCLERAIGMALILKKHAERVYASVHGGDYASARALAKRLINGQVQDGFSVREVYAKHWGSLNDVTSVQHAVEALLQHGWLFEYQAKTVGRTTNRYRINPGIGEVLL